MNELNPEVDKLLKFFEMQVLDPYHDFTSGKESELSGRKREKEGGE
jgi:hypothetical protein